MTGEAGLNEGLAFPFVLFGLFVAADRDWNWVGEWIAADVVYAVAIGVAIGAVACPDPHRTRSDRDRVAACCGTLGGGSGRPRFATRPSEKEVVRGEVGST